MPEFQAVRRDVEDLKQARGGGGGGSSSRLAELGVEVASLHEEIANMRGEIEAARHLADTAMEEAVAAREVASRASAAARPATRDASGSGSGPTSQGQPAAGSPNIVTPTAAPTPMSGVGGEVRDYEEAFRRYRAGEHVSAIDRFQAFLQTHPSSDYADNALFWMGESHFKLGDHEQAAVTFDQVVKQYPDGNKVPDALYRQGIALLEIGKKTGQSASYTPAARQIFERIVRDHSSSPRVTEARRQLEILGQ
ncbi:MAG: tol-pal system protein YbgF [bacterium]|nr:tol-pal system protein YbgF [bacterium]